MKRVKRTKRIDIPYVTDLNIKKSQIK